MRVRFGRLAACCVVCIGLAHGAAHADQTVRRSTQFTYDATTGLLTAERLDPGGAHCAETLYQHDRFGNRTRIEVRSCGAAENAFPTRVTLHRYDATAGFAEGAVVTATRTGDASLTWTAGALATEQRFTYDRRTGAVTSTTDIALALLERDLTRRTEVDGFGRVTAEVLPVARRADGSVTEVRTESRLVRCTGPGISSRPEGCLSVSGLSPIPVSFASGHLVDASSQPRREVTPRITSAYFFERLTRGPDGTAIDAPSRVHFDALHREIAREHQGFDRRWVRTMTAYDPLGLVAATWGPHFVDQSPDDFRQWTSERDALHRPVRTERWVRVADGAPLQLASTTVAYAGATQTVTESVGGDARTRSTLTDALGRVVQTVDPVGSTVSFALDPLGQTLVTRDALDKKTTVVYTPGTARFKERVEDPDRGTWRYTWDAAGQLRTQTDARGKTTTLAYDALGRLTERRTDDLVSRWRYDRDLAGSPCAGGLPRLCEAWTGQDPPRHSTRRVLAYDSLGRQVAEDRQLDRSYVTRTAFDELGRPAVSTYPSGLAVRRVYSSGTATRAPGVLSTVHREGQPAQRYWSLDEGTAFDARGRLLQASLGNGVRIRQRPDPGSERLFALSAGNGANDNVFDHRYAYDGWGRLVQRRDAITALTEAFEHDALDRLTRWSVDGPDARSVTTRYNALGNVLTKSDVGGYAYAGPRPHAVTSAGDEQFSYDANGNVVATTGPNPRSHTWTDFDRPGTLQQANRRVEFSYDDRLQRVREVLVAPGTAGRTTFMVHPDDAGGLGFEREVRYAGSPYASAVTGVANRHFIAVPGAMVVVTTREATNGPGIAGNPGDDAADTLYWHRDLLGSVVAVSNGAGRVQERVAFDAWGRRLWSDGRIDTRASGSAHGERGFTGHEHLDELGLVHMNARVYDPRLARFLSPDPVIQSPEQLQNLNAYSYVLNAPTAFTDPSGACVGFLVGVDTALCAALSSTAFHGAMFMAGAMMSAYGNRHWQMLGSVLMTAGLGTADGLLMGTKFVTDPMIAGAIAGGVSSFISSQGDVHAALSGAASGAAFGAIGAAEINDAARVAAHAVVGCIQAAATGGECGPSAMAAAVGKLVTLNTASLGTGPQFLVTALAGGTASALGGGKFGNGAVTAAFGYLLNQLSSPRKEGRDIREDGWNSNSGRGPNDRGSDAENLVRVDLQSRGYTFIDRQVTTLDGSRVYDLLMRGPDGRLFVVEAKSTLTGFFRSNSRQVAIDVNLMQNGATLVTPAGDTYAGVRHVIYQGVDFSSNLAAALANWRAATIIRGMGGDVSVQQVGPKQ